MSLRPSKLRPGEQLHIAASYSSGPVQTAYFVRRVPRHGSRPPVNYVRFPAYAGMDGPDDDGTCQMSDYDLSRRGTAHG